MKHVVQKFFAWFVTVSLLVGVCVIEHAKNANAMSVSNTISGTIPVVTNSSSSSIRMPATLGTGYNVANYRSMAFDFSYSSWYALGGATAYTLTCCGQNELQSLTMWQSTCLNPQVITATTSAGVSTTAPASWTTTSGQVSSSCTLTSPCGWTWIVSNIVWPTVYCTVTGSGSVNSNDKLSVGVRFVTP